jgi:hypothetical protein
LIKVAPNLENLGAINNRLGQFAQGNLAFGHEDHAVHVRLGGIRRRGRRGIARGATNDGLGAVGLGLGNRHGHATVLKGA